MVPQTDRGHDANMTREMKFRYWAAAAVLLGLIGPILWSRTSDHLLDMKYRAHFSGVAGIADVLQFYDYDGTLFAELQLTNVRIAVGKFDERSFDQGGRIVLYAVDGAKIGCLDRKGGNVTMFSLFDVVGGRVAMDGVPHIRNFQDLVHAAPALKHFVDSHLLEGRSNAREVVIDGQARWCHRFR